MIQSNNLQQTKDNAIEKYPDLRDTRQHLDDCTITPHRRLPQAFTQKPNERKTGTGVATALLRVDPQHGHLAPLVPRACRASRLSCLVPLASQARAPLKHVRLSSTCASQQRAPPSNVRFSPAHRQTRALSPSILSYSDHLATSFHLSHSYSTLSLSQVL